MFDMAHRPKLQADVISGAVDPDDLLPELLEFIGAKSFNLFYNMDTGQRTAAPVARRGNDAYARRQSFKRADLEDLMSGVEVSYRDESGEWSYFIFVTLTFDHNK